MVGLRRSDPSGPGLSRRRAGRGFAYYDQAGARITDADELARVRSMVIPPAWQQVWIAASPGGHIQALGIDAAGRRQYIYHEEWRRRRDLAKFDRMTDLGRRLPRIRRRIDADLRRHTMADRLRGIGCSPSLSVCSMRAPFESGTPSTPRA